MSVVIVDRTVVDEIVSTMIRYGLTDLAGADTAGQVLFDENARSIRYRYAASMERSTEAPAYDYRPAMATIGHRAKTLTFYAYMANEAPTWETSEARAMCLRLAFAMLSEIPGYSEAVI